MDPKTINQEIINLYDSYTHGGINRRRFFDRLVVLAGGTAAATAMISLLQNNYAKAEMVPADDSRIKTETVTFTAGSTQLSAYLASPADGAKHPAVLVVHENRGLNPHTQDTARRFAVDGFTALAVDFLSPIGGTPTDEDKAREMIGTLNAPDVTGWAQGAVAYLRSHAASNGKVGAVGFCWGGGVIGRLAVAEPSLDAGVVYYGAQPPAEDVAKIQAPLLLNYAGLDERINAGIPAFEEALKANDKRYTLYMYEGAQHAFNNDTNAPRYNKDAAELAWGRTIGFFKEHLSAGA